jgi:hypothetical protein
MKQTAVQFLIEQISSSKYFYNLMKELESRSTIVQPNGILQQAKEMEKEQISDAWYAGDEDGPIHDFEDYYNETFKKD